MSTLKVNALQDTSGNNLSRVLQVVQTVKTDTASTSVAQGAHSEDLIALSYAATSSSNKLLIHAVVQLSCESNANIMATLYIGGSASAFIGDANGSRQRVSVVQNEAASGQTANFVISYLLSSPSTSSTSYAIKGSHMQDATKNMYINRQHYQPDANYSAMSASSITILEIAA